MRPITKFILVTIDEIIIIAILVYAVYVFFPEYFLIALIISIIGTPIFVIAKYIIVRETLSEKHYKYDVVGYRGRVVKKLTPKGSIRVRGEIWRAISETGEHILEGEEVFIVRREGNVLYVKRCDYKVDEKSNQSL